MATDVQALFLQVDASVELLRKHMAEGEQPLDQFAARVDTMADRVDRSIGSMGSRFGAFAELAQSAATRAQKSFEDSFSQVERLAARALQSSRVGGGVSLGADEARQAAQAASQHAAALRLVEEAARRASAGEGELTRETRLYLAAANAAAVEAERNAAELTREAGAVERLEIELNRLNTAQLGVIAPGRNVTTMAGQQRAGMQQLGFQLNDVAVQFAAGTSPMIIFAQQSGQVIQAISLMTQGTKGFLGFLGGPWGIVITTALVALTPFVAKLFQTDEAAKKALEGLRAFENKELDLPGLIDATTGKLRDQTAALRELGRVSAQVLPSRIADAMERGGGARFNAFKEAREFARQQLISGNRDGTLEGDIRRAGTSANALNEAIQKLAPFRSPEFGEMARRVAYWTAQQAIAIRDVRKLQGDLYTARTVNSGGSILTPESIRRSVQDGLASTAVERAQIKTRDASDELDRIGRLPVSAEQQAALARAKANYEAAERALKTAQGAAKTAPSLGSQVDAARGADLLSSAARYRGLSETGDRGELMTLFKQANLNVDPKITAWCAAFVNAVLATNGMTGTGNLAARSFLAYGEKTSTPVKGDIVVSQRGSDPSKGHVGFYQGTDAKGNILVLGGNTADEVGTQAIPRSQVLGFRRPSAGASDRALNAQAMAAQREISEDISFTDAERAARKRLLDARQRTAATQEQADQLAREEINADAAALTKKYGLLEQADKLDKAEADRLRGLAEETRIQQLRNVEVERASRVIGQQYDARQHGLEAETAQLRLQQDLATTAAERRQVAADLLAAEQELRRLALERVRDDPKSTPAQVQQALGDLAALPKTEQLEREKGGRENLGPLAAYRQQLVEATSDIDTALENVGVNGLRTLEDGLVGVVQGTKSVGEAFRDMAASIIADLARIAIQKAIVKAIGGSFFGLAEGGAIADVPGFAGGGSPGGMISGPGTGTSDSILAILGGGKGAIRVSDQEFIVNAAATKRWLPLLAAINAGRLPGFARGGAIGSPRVPDLRMPSVPDLSGRGRGGFEKLRLEGEIAVSPTKEFDARMTRLSLQTVAASAEPIMSGAQDRTVTKLRRASLPGGFDA